MNTDGMLIVALVIMVVGFILLILSQAKQIQVLKDENQKLRSGENYDELIVLAQEKLKVDGDIKTIKYVREQTGMSLVEAKQFVDRIKNPQ